jgi:hypothetical protein
MAEKAIQILNWLYQTYGGSVRATGKETEKWQARYCWTLTTDQAICFLARIQRYMTIKREIALEILKADLVDNDLWRGKHRRWTEARFAAFEEARNVALRVNKKGPPDSRPDWIARRVGNRWESKQGNLLTGLSETFSGNWPRAGSLRNGCVYPQERWAPAMGGNGGSALRGETWAAPTTNEHTGAGQGPNKTGAPNLRTQVDAWPTPKGSDGTKGSPNQAGSKGDLMLPSAAAQWPTPSASVANDGESPETWHARAAKLKEKGINGNGAGLPLTVAAVQWPTPAARDSKGANSEEHCTVTGGGRKHMDQLSNFVAHSSLPALQTQDGETSSDSGPNSPRRLNPLFGEHLMGWPSQWTKAEPSASSASATESFRCRLQQHLSCLLGEQGLE